MPLPPTARLGPYEILSSIGAGGMGEVYRAKDTRLDRTVAIKVVSEGLAKNPQARERFEREARAVSSLNHPRICTLHDIGHQDGIDYLVMEYLEGETMARRHAKGALPLDQSLRFAIEIADALDVAHRHGVIHRDLKPGNVMLQPLWRRDGKELFYLTSDGKLTAADVKGGANLEIGAPHILFQTRVRVNPNATEYCVTGDGKRFILREPVGESSAPITVVLNWTAGLKR